MTIHKIVFFFLVLAFSSVLNAQTFNVVNNDINDPFLSEAVIDWTEVVSRIVYSPTPINFSVSSANLGTALGTGGASFSSDTARAVSLGLDPAFAYPEPLLIASGADRVPEIVGDTDMFVTISSTPNWDLGRSLGEEGYSPTPLVNVLAHEILHGLAYSSSINAGDGSLIINDKYTVYDKGLLYRGEPLIDLDTDFERLAATMSVSEVSYQGEIVEAYVLEMVSAGADQGVIVYAPINDAVSQPIVHLDFSVFPDTLMEPAIDPAMDHFGISMAVLADVGYGDLVDTHLALQNSSDEGFSVSVTSDSFHSSSVVENVYLSMELPSGVTFSSLEVNSAVCEIDTGKYSCRLDNYLLGHEQLFTFEAEGVPGIYDVVFDVEHKASHVDEDPFNNFIQAKIQVGVNPLIELGLSNNGEIDQSVDIQESSSSSVEIGEIILSGETEGLAIEYSLSGDQRFSIVDGILTSSEALDHEEAASYDLTLTANADNGFSITELLTIEVLDTSDDGCLNNLIVSTQGLDSFSLLNQAVADDIQGKTAFISSLILLAVFVLALSLIGGNLRYIAYLLLFSALMLTGCGGGGGGSSPSAPPSSQTC